MEVHWLDLCHASRNQRLSVILASGNAIDGDCINVTENEMRVSSRDQGTVGIARGSMKQVFARHGQTDHELATLVTTYTKGCKVK